MDNLDLGWLYRMSAEHRVSCEHLRSRTQEGQAWKRANPTGLARRSELPHTFLSSLFLNDLLGDRSLVAVGAMDYVSHLTERSCLKQASLRGVAST